jgi:carbon-monoxide dehydrogenase medium subunit
LKPAPFVYHAPATLDEALELLGEHGNARALAGGQSLMPMLNFRLAAPDHLVDLNRIATLAYIREQQGQIVIGAMTRQRDIESSELIARRLPLLAEAIRHVGHRQTRNRGTLGGSLAHLDPAAELPMVAMAFDAELQLQSRRGARTVSMASFPKGALASALEADELITEVRFRPWPQDHRHAFVEFSRRHGDFALASAAVLMIISKDHIEALTLTLGGVAATPLKIETQDLVGKKPSADLFEKAASRCAEIDALEDPVYPAWYRRKLAVTLARRALESAVAR